MTYDKAGNLKKYTDGNGNATVSKFDSLLDRCFSPKMQLVI